MRSKKTTLAQLAKVKPKNLVYVVDMRHDSGSDPTFAVRKWFFGAVQVAHKFAQDYDIEVKDGKPFDLGNDDGNQGGFKCFTNVKMHNGQIAEFTHCGGDGPCCTITEVKDQDVVDG